MNLTTAMHEASRFADAVFAELLALLTAPDGAGEGIELRQMHRAPGPVNSKFAVSLELFSERQSWTAEFAIPEWKDLPDRSPSAMARALAEEIRQMLSSCPPPEVVPRRRLFRRS